jgi:protein-S-isoprenylcysteine O-methyltransferase Ste14
VAWLSLALTAVFAVFDGFVPNLLYRRRTGRLLIRHGRGASGWFGVLWVGTVFVSGPVAELAGLQRLASDVVLIVFGVAMAIGGIAIVYWAQRSMGDSLRIGVDPGEHTGLVTKGIFAWVRNPIYSAMILYAVGTALLVPNVVSITAFGAFVLAMEFQVRRIEEPFLRQMHGADYETYLYRVGRFLPGVGRLANP